MTTRANRYSLHYRTTKIERMLGIVNKWTRLPEGADIYTAPPRPDASAQSNAEQAMKGMDIKEAEPLFTAQTSNQDAYDAGFAAALRNGNK